VGQITRSAHGGGGSRTRHTARPVAPYLRPLLVESVLVNIESTKKIVNIEEQSANMNKVVSSRLVESVFL
jgi:hypothetical protein